MGIEKESLKVFEFGAGAQLPTFEEVINSKNYVFFGNDNLWPRHTIQMYNYSPTNRACLNAIISGIIGENLLINGQEGFMMVNSTETLYDVFKKTAVDFAIHSGFAMNTIKTKDENGIASIYHIDFSKVRSGKVDSFDYVKEYYYSADWSNIHKYKPIEIPAFNLQGEGDSQIYYAFPYAPDQKYYPLPAYIGGRIPIQTEIEIFNYELNYIQNGYFPSLFISMNQGVPGEEEREAIYRHLEEKYSSSNRAGNLILSFSDSKENEPTITPIAAANNADMFAALIEKVQEKIIVSHGISKPDLLGIKTTGQLGSRQEMVEGYEHFIKTQIAPKQQYLLREFEKLLFYMTGEVKKLEIVQNTLFDGDGGVDTGIVDINQKPQDNQVVVG